jgi:hydrogenase nickel incorporation protein HypA/HybF
VHELSIAMSMIDVAEEQAAGHGGDPPAVIYVRVGALSGVLPGALSAAYELAREHTTLAECQLVIERVPGAELLLTALEFSA